MLSKHLLRRWFLTFALHFTLPRSPSPTVSTFKTQLDPVVITKDKPTFFHGSAQPSCGIVLLTVQTNWRDIRPHAQTRRFKTLREPKSTPCWVVGRPNSHLPVTKIKGLDAWQGVTMASSMEYQAFILQSTPPVRSWKVFHPPNPPPKMREANAANKIQEHNHKVWWFVAFDCSNCTSYVVSA